MPLQISVLSVFPDVYTSFIETSLIGRAQRSGLVDIKIDTLFSAVSPKQRIDAPTFGHSAGMIIKPEVVERAIESNEAQRGKAFRVFFSPRGERLNQRTLERMYEGMQKAQHGMLVAARYEGIDARAEEYYADMVVSVGDFVLMGGDLPAMMTLEGLLRLVPGVVGRQESVMSDSFTGAFVDYPEYTEPVTWKGKTVPEVLRSGNHKRIDEWRLQEAARESVLKHFSWLRSHHMTDEQRTAAWSHVPPHYVTLLHTDVLIGAHEVGTTSVTSLDIHDIARSARTYGIKNYFIVTPLVDQQKIVRKLLDFWQHGDGTEYNRGRHEALMHVSIEESLQQVIDKIKELEGKEPLLIASSARTGTHAAMISYDDQEQVWTAKRPVLLILGTGKGLSNQIIERCDFLLTPIRGFTDFNHLSVRSAAAVIFDRWLGLRQPV